MKIGNNRMNVGQSSRFAVVGAFFVLVGFLVIGRLISFQSESQKEIFILQGEKYSGIQSKLVPIRGKIYDRWGHLLAGNEPVYEIGVDLREENLNTETIALAGKVILGLDYNLILSKLKQDIASGGWYFLLDKFATIEEADQFKELMENYKQNPSTSGVSSNGKKHSLSGLEIESRFLRTYPEDNLASNVLGFVTLEQKSVLGIEGYYNHKLSGVKRDYWYPYDPNRVTELPDSVEGTSLILTLDREIQASVEEILDNSIDENGAYAGTIVVMDPKTGEIYAMATSPRININEYWHFIEDFEDDQFFNLAIQHYEPGSVFKVFTMASALDSDTVEIDTVFVDTGKYKILRNLIYNWDRGAWGPQSMLGCMQYSLNVCLAWVADQMGPDLFYSYMQAFGFGHPTGIGLEAESSGHLKLPGDSDWDKDDLGTNSFGQGISVTPVQMLMGLSAVANDGKMVVPRIVHSVIDGDEQTKTSVQIAGEPISKETANKLSNMLATSLEEEASDALVPGYRVAGKTGTAEIGDRYGYSESLTNASFAGWGPVDDAQFIVYIWLEKPTKSPWGSVVAAPIFKEVVQRIVLLLNIPSDPIRQSLTITEGNP